MSAQRECRPRSPPSGPARFITICMIRHDTASRELRNACLEIARFDSQSFDRLFSWSTFSSKWDSDAIDVASLINQERGV